MAIGSVVFIKLSEKEFDSVITQAAFKGKMKTWSDLKINQVVGGNIISKI